MKYKITVERIDQVEEKGEFWEKIADTGNKTDGGAVYGYVPKIVTKKYETTVYYQEKNEIDLIKIIEAVNIR